MRSRDVLRAISLVTIIVAGAACPSRRAPDESPPPTPREAAVMHDAAASPADTRVNTDVIFARYLGRSDMVFYEPVDGSYQMSRTKQCDRRTMVRARVFFALEGASPWTTNEYAPEQLARMAMLLPCPELTRAAFQALFPDADEGRGSAPVLEPGRIYRLEVRAQPHLSEPEDASGVGTEAWELTSVDPAAVP